ncbi:MAG: peptidoglycan-binding domain-containing protein [Desulfonatronovibrionaceae bacterium]
MSKSLVLSSVILILSCLAFGCSSLQKLKQPRTEFTQAPFELQAPSVRMRALKDLPADINLVTAAVIKKMRRESGSIRGVKFASSQSFSTLDSDFDYQGLAVTKITLVDHWARPAGNGAFKAKLRGVLEFSDTLGRRALMDYLVHYEFTRKNVVIDKARVLPVAPIFPNAQAFFIPADKLKRIASGPTDFATFYTRVVEGALALTPSAEEIQNRQAQKQKGFWGRLAHSSGKERENIYMVIFVMDRLTPDAKLDVVVTEQLYDKNTLIKAAYMDFSGWRAAVFGGKFALDLDKFYTKVHYKPAKGVLPQGKDKVLIGLFCSEKNYGDNIAGEYKEANSVTEGPLAAGHRVLQTSSRDDAAVIQSRLAELGFYSMKVDGLWGPGSRAALKRFQMNRGLSPDGKWGVATQMKLFAGTGR